MSYSMNEIWEKVLSNVQTIINKQSFDMWLKDTKPINFQNKILKIRVSDEVALRHISENYLSLLSSIASDIAGESVSCVFTTQKNEETNLKHDTTTSNEDVYNKNQIASSLMLYPEYTFENFIVGPNNQLAHAAAISVSKAPAIKFNPLFIYGKTGLGKTHLMQAIGHKIIKEKPYMKVLYISTEQFTNEFINAIINNTRQSFSIKYRQVDILLIDDIHFIEGKEQTQEEFFHTFNTLHNNNKQIVITCDRPPKELTTLEERLRSRFEWGMITDIQPPTIETREAILRSKAEKLKLNLSDEVLNYIARRITSNIRALESALTRLNMVSSLVGEPITVNHAKQHLKDLFDIEISKKISISDIIQKVCQKFNVSPEDIKSKSRHSRVVLPRFVAMYIARNLTELTTLEIGREFGDRDHSTVIHAINNIEKMIKKDENLNEQINEIIFELKC